MSIKDMRSLYAALHTFWNDVLGDPSLSEKDLENWKITLGPDIKALQKEFKRRGVRPY